MDAEKFGEWMRQGRHRMGLRQSEVGDLLGVTKSYVMALERALPQQSTRQPRRPSAGRVDRIAEILDLDANEGRAHLDYPPVSGASAGSLPRLGAFDREACLLLSRANGHLADIRDSLMSILLRLAHLDQQGSAPVPPGGYGADSAQRQTVPASTTDPAESGAESAPAPQAEGETPSRTEGASPLILVVCNPRQEVGKTTTTALLTPHCAEQGRLLVIDADAQGGLTQFFSRADAEKSTLRDILEQTQTLEEAVEEITWNAIPFDFLGAEPDLTPLPGAYTEFPLYEYRLRQALAGYEYVLVDCPSTLNEIVDLWLSLADAVLVPTTAESMSRQGARLLIERLAERRPDPDTRPVSYGLWTRLQQEEKSRETAEAMMAIFGENLLNTVMPEEPDLGRLAAFYGVVAEELLGRLDREDGAE